MSFQPSRTCLASCLQSEQASQVSLSTALQSEQALQPSHLLRASCCTPCPHRLIRPSHLLTHPSLISRPRPILRSNQNKTHRSAVQSALQSEQALLLVAFLSPTLTGQSEQAVCSAVPASCPASASWPRANHMQPDVLCTPAQLAGPPRSRASAWVPDCALSVSRFLYSPGPQCRSMAPSHSTSPSPGGRDFAGHCDPTKEWMDAFQTTGPPGQS